MGRINKDQLARFVELQQKRRALDRQSKILKREENAIRADIVAECESKGGGFTRFGFRCVLTPRAGRPRWQDEFISRVGAETAAKIEAATPPTMILNVHQKSD
jgi:hypothetical protein